MASAAIGRGRASLTLLVLVIVFQLGLLSLSVDARPCKTLLIAYSFSFTGNPAFIHHHHHNHLRRHGHPFPVIDFAKPDLSSSDSASSSSEELITIFDVSDRQLDRKPAFLFFNRRVFPYRELELPRPRYPHLPQQQQQRSVPLGFFDMSSLRDRTVDILSVVVALLFGVGCGALTAATMYLVWSLFASHRGDDFQEESDDEDASPKKMGYVKIPAADAFPAPTKA